MGKLKRQKHNKRTMAVYSQSFGFRHPYQVIVDGNFLHVAKLAGKNIEETLPKHLGGPVRLMTTYCAQVELRQLGEEMRHSASLAKKLEKRRCTHNPAVSAAECIKQVIGAYNKDHYCVATQDSDLRILLREIPGTPLIYMNNSATVLEPVSSITMDRVKQLELKKLQPKEFERIPSSNRGLNQSGLVHKRRKIKEPNPLSVKKPKKIPSDSAVDAKNNAQGSKRKRKRKSSGLPSIEENESGPTA